jgi:hypothetical protein
MEFKLCYDALPCLSWDEYESLHKGIIVTVGDGVWRNSSISKGNDCKAKFKRHCGVEVMEILGMHLDLGRQRNPRRENHRGQF